MTFKVFTVLAVVAVANSAVIPGAPVVAEVDTPAHYSYGYQVSDPITGDHKHQQETRHGDAVQGSYSLVESDGTRRIVEYAADDISGFNAVVRKEPLAVHAAAPVVPHVAPQVPAVNPQVVPSVAAVHPVTPQVVPSVAARVAVPSYSPYHAAYTHSVYSPYHHYGHYAF
ncbi:hypothetical protein HHI36_021785 [Cryptolaemus montrouzieri]|uniref:Cuticle protein n=1 Tax=Cryptolaemus montrouzieri TaxID=559131 RepID=A0ABD2MXY2_9CUCU